MHDSVTVHMAAPADEIWDLLSDVTKIGRYSPETFEAEWLDGAVAAGLVVASDADAPGTLRFSHALVREAVVAGLGPTARARAHARVAQALIAREPLDDDRVELPADRIGHCGRSAFVGNMHQRQDAFEVHHLADQVRAGAHAR